MLLKSKEVKDLRTSSILVAVSGEEVDDEAVMLACELAHPSRGKVYILYVIEVERGFPLDAEIAPATAKAEEVLRHVEQVAKSYKCKVEAELVQSRQAGCAIVQEAVDRGVDIVALGAPYKERYGSFSLGETIHYVLKNAPCRVLVLRGEAPSKVASDGANGHKR